MNIFASNTINTTPKDLTPALDSTELAAYQALVAEFIGRLREERVHTYFKNQPSLPPVSVNLEEYWKGSYL